MNDLVAGQIDVMIDQTSNSISQVRAGSIRAYAITDDKRVESASDIPTTDEAGLSGFHMTLWSVFGCRKTRRKTSSQSSTRGGGCVERSGVRKQLKTRTADAAEGSALAGGARTWQKAEIAKWWPMIKAANVKVD